MTVDPKRLALALACCSATSPALAQAPERAAELAYAQPAGLPAGEDLTALNGGPLRSEVQARFDAAVAATRDPAIVAADNPRYIWASEAKVQCGIALGYLRSGHKDPVSLRKCSDFALWMTRQPTEPYGGPGLGPGPGPISQLPPPMACEQPGTVFFEFDSAQVSSDAAQTVAYVANTMQSCRRTALTITGHADRSGSDSYNYDLSMRRAEAVAAILTSAGVARSALAVSARGEREPRVPTPDGVQNPQNRRVEIAAN